MNMITIGIIGGSGLYDMAELTDREERRVETPFGEPSAPYVIGTLRGKRVAFLARHGAGHRLLPTELNFRANIFGFKMLGVEFILSASAVGSLQGGIRAARSRHPGSVLRSHEGPRLDVLRPRASSRTSGSRTRSAGRSASIAYERRSLPAEGRRRRRRSTRAAPTSAWKGRSSRRWPSRSCIGRGAWTSSA